jgi:hypothetical protein
MAVELSSITSLKHLKSKPTTCTDHFCNKCCEKTKSSSIYTDGTFFYLRLQHLNNTTATCVKKWWIYDWKHFKFRTTTSTKWRCNVAHTGSLLKNSQVTTYSCQQPSRSWSLHSWHGRCGVDCSWFGGLCRMADQGGPCRRLLTVYFGAPSMFITLWFGFDYGTNPPLGTLII